jgi:serine/threonine protein phosphatase PrpC
MQSPGGDTLPRPRRSRSHGALPRPPRKHALFQPTVPVVRATADATLRRPPRLTYGYSAVSGSTRDYAPGSSNTSSDRVFFADHFTGSNEMALFGAVEGAGFAGAKIAAWLTDVLPDLLPVVAEATAKKKKKPKGEGETDDPAAALFSLERPGAAKKPAKLSEKPTDYDRVAAAAKAIMASVGGDEAAAGGSPERRPAGSTAASADGTPSSPPTSALGMPALTRVQTRVGEITRDTLRAAHAELHRAQSRRPDLDATASGASVCLCVVRGRTLAVAHVGAVRAVLGRAVDALSLQSAVAAVDAVTQRGVLETSVARSPEAMVAGGGLEGGGAAGGGSGGTAALLAGGASVSSAYSSAGQGSTILSASSASSVAAGYDAHGSSTSSLDNKYNKMSSANRLARLLHSVGSLDLGRPGFGHIGAAAADGGAKPPASSAASAKPRAAADPLTGTLSLPAFPDLPAVLEAALVDPARTYRKPSAMLQEQRREVVVAVKRGASRGGMQQQQGGLAASALRVTVPSGAGGPRSFLTPSSTAPSDGSPLASPSLITDLTVLALATKDPREKARLVEAAEMQELAARIGAARFTPAGRLVSRGTLGMVAARQREEQGAAADDAHEQTGEADDHPNVPVSARSSSGGHHTAGSRHGGGLGDDDDGAPVDYSQPPQGWEGSDLARAVASKYGKVANAREAAAAAAAVAMSGGAGHLDDAHQQHLALRDARFYDDHGRPIAVPCAVPLTVDHRPDRPDEKLRISRCGGKVEVGVYADGTRGALPRVFGLTSDGPGVALSRCVGFFAGQSVGLSCEPEVSVRTLDAHDRFVIVASDGLWAALSSDEAVRVVSRVCDGMLWGGTGASAFVAPAGANGNVPASSLFAAVGSARGFLGPAAAADEHDHDHGVSLPLPAALTTSALPVSAHPASLAVAALPSLASRPALPPLEHPSPHVHVAPAPGTELRVSACAGVAPVAGCGGGGCDLPTDLADSVSPAHERRLRQDRMRRVALAAAEALVAAAKARWAAQTGGRGGGGGWGRQTPVGGPGGGGTAGAFDDIAVLVVLLDHVSPA